MGWSSGRGVCDGADVVRMSAEMVVGCREGEEDDGDD